MRRNCGFSWANRLLRHIGGLAERATKQPLKAKVGSVSVELKEAVIAKNPKTLEDAVDAAAEVAENLIPYGIPICGSPHLVQIPSLARGSTSPNSPREQ